MMRLFFSSVFYGNAQAIFGKDHEKNFSAQ